MISDENYKQSMLKSLIWHHRNLMLSYKHFKTLPQEEDNWKISLLKDKQILKTKQGLQHFKQVLPHHKEHHT
ncbi:MAG: hypothetical protein EBR82_53040 [Caulobacteraceae bacterium]|nr:hypothetical protein [Caulobacteraceae bacterium]